MVVREGLDGPPGPATSEAAQWERFERMLADLQQRQRAGELAADLDPAAVGLAMFAMCAAPVSFLHLARAVGLDPAVPGFAEQHSAQAARSPADPD